VDLTGFIPDSLVENESINMPDLIVSGNSDAETPVALATVVETEVSF
jgi:hypothetical protein